MQVKYLFYKPGISMGLRLFLTLIFSAISAIISLLLGFNHYSLCIGMLIISVVSIAAQAKNKYVLIIIDIITIIISAIILSVLQGFGII